MNLDFKPSAVEFVRKNNCANHTPVELIQKAMEQGECEALDFAAKRVAKSHAELKKQRAGNLSK